MSPALNGRFVLQPFERGNLIKITNRIMFDSTQEYAHYICIHALPVIHVHTSKCERTMKY